MSDRISLTLPRERPFFRIAHLVLGGLAVRLDLTFEALEDLQLALAGILDVRPAENGHVTVTVSVEHGAVRARVGPFDGDAVREQLDDEPVDDERVGLRRLLDTVVDGVEIEDEEEGCYVEFVKSVERVGS